MENNTNVNKERYKLHNIIKREGYKFKPRKKIIYIPYNKTDNLSDNVKRLMKEFNYKVQTEMFE